MVNNEFIFQMKSPAKIFQQQRFCQSIMVEAKQGSQCPFCRNQIQPQLVIERIKNIGESVQKMKIESFSVQEEVQLLLDSFSYILELVATNITNEVNKRIPQILAKKNEIISKQFDKIRKLEEDHFQIEHKLMMGSENKYANPVQEKTISNLKDTVYDLKLHQSITRSKLLTFDQKSTNKKKRNQVPSIVFGSKDVKKQKSEELDKNNDIIIFQGIRSLDNLREKINKLKDGFKSKRT